MILKLMKKELKELLKTGRFYALLITFLFFAISSPPITKFTPEIIKSLIQTQDTKGIIIQIPSPTWKDSFLQFFKNLNQIIFIVLIIIFIGCISEEKNKGTAVTIIVRGIDRKKWIISKFLFQILICFILLIISYIICAYYTFFLFSHFPLYNSLSSTILYAFYLIFVISLIIFSSSIGNNAIQSGGIFFIIFIILNIINIFPNLNSYNPIYLSTLQNQWITQSVNWQSALKPILSTLIMSTFLIYIGMIYFDRQEL